VGEILIQESDFKSIELKISALNLESKVELLDGERIVHLNSRKKKKSKADNHNRIQLIEITAKGMVIEVPAKFAAKDQKLELMIDVFNSSALKHVDIEARVEKVEYFEQLKYSEGETVEVSVGTRDTLTLTLLDPEDDAWLRLQIAYRDRQDEIADFFQQVKP
jgi:hypothetical protein